MPGCSVKLDNLKLGFYITDTGHWMRPVSSQLPGFSTILTKGIQLL